MSVRPHKPIKDLVPGDLILMLKPQCRARVTGIRKSQTPIKRHGCGPTEPTSPALIVDFIYRDGPLEGRKSYVFVHPESKVALP